MEDVFMTYGFKKYKKEIVKGDHLNLGQTRDDGKSISINSRFISKDGIPWIGVMGEYHYVRDNCENWEIELAKMKAGGITTVATYVFWIYHQEIEEKYDFSGDRDLRRFAKLCQKSGLSMVLRIGPWCHGEVRNGGFPDWLLEKDCKLRENNPVYLELVKKWYQTIYQQVKGLFFKDGGPIIGIQIENELVDDAQHLGKLKEIAREIGFDVPIWTVTGWNSLYGAKFPLKEFLPVFGAYVDAPWLEHTNKLPPSKHFTFDTNRNDAAIGMDLIGATDEDGWALPYEDYPFATCELGSGLPLSYIRRPYVSGMDAYSLSLVKLGCGNNLVGYYMYHGGANKLGSLSTLQESKATGYPNDYAILNYDFQTCIGQYGQIRDKYRLCNLLHLFVNEFGHILAPMESVAADKFIKEDDRSGLRYAMRTNGESGFIFVNHHQRGLVLDDVFGAELDTGIVKLPPIDIKGDIAFILPFNLEFREIKIDYALAQLLCSQDNNLYFAAIPGISPKFSIGGIEYNIDINGYLDVTGVRINVLSWERALYLRKIDGKVYFGEGKDLYKLGDEIIGISYERAEFTTEDVEQPFEAVYKEEFAYGGEYKLSWKKIQVSSPEGMVEIPFEYDVAQLYVDNKFVADSFYYGKPWQLPAKMLYGKEAYIALSDSSFKFYMDAK